MVDCDRAANLISARLDGELPADDAIALDAHLAECAGCRATAESTESLDAGLVRAFAPHRDTGAALAERVTTAFSNSHSTPARTRPSRSTAFLRLVRWPAAVAAGFAAAVLLRPDAPSTRSPSPIVHAQPIAQFTANTGRVFTCPSGGNEWQPVAAGQPIAPGSRVRTADAGKCELRLDGGAVVRLNADSEACFPDAASVHLASGQAWSTAHAPGGPPLQVVAGATRVTVPPATTTQPVGTQFDVACTPETTTVAVLRGSASVTRPGEQQRADVRAGETARIGSRAGGPDLPPLHAFTCSATSDAAMLSAWQDDLLLLKPADDAEVQARVDALLRRLAAEAKPSTTPLLEEPAGRVHPLEALVRARGDAWAAPLAQYLKHSGGDRAWRRAAARLLADVAPPALVSDMIALVGDADEQVRFHTAAALHRLTGQTLGFSATACAANPADPAIVARWQKWWAENKHRYPPGR